MNQEAPISIVQVVRPPPPVLVCDANARRWTGHDVRAWRKLARSMAAAGYPVRETTAGLCAVMDDVIEYMRAAPRLPTRAYAKSEPIDAEEDLYRKAVGQ